MKKTIINRYETTPTGQVIIDVSVSSVESLYHDFDKTAPYHRKELDQEFAEYLVQSAREIRKHPFIIRISLEKTPDEKLIERVGKSIDNYYEYLKQIETHSAMLILKRFSVLFTIGLVFLVLAILANRGLVSHPGVVAEVFAQGLTIAAWISLWEALVNIFLERRPHIENIRLYDRIIDCPIMFR